MLHAEPEYEDVSKRLKRSALRNLRGHMLTQRSGVPVYVAAIQIFR